MAFKYSVYQVMVPELGYEDTAQLAAEYGYDGIEWRIGMSGNHHPYDSVVKPARGVAGDYKYWTKVRETIEIADLVENAPRLKKIAADNGLAIPAMGTYLNLGTPNLLPQAEEVFKAAEIMECPQFRIGSPKYFRDKTVETYQQLYKGAIEKLTEIEKLSRRYGVKANIEIHADSLSPSAALSFELVRHFDPKCIGVTFDPGNMIKEGWENWRLGMQILGDYLAHFHAKNCGWYVKGKRPDGAAVWERRWVTIKDGGADFRTIVADLKSVGYDGWISFEDFAELPTEQKIADNIEYLKQLEREVEATAPVRAST